MTLTSTNAMTTGPIPVVVMRSELVQRAAQPDPQFILPVSFSEDRVPRVGERVAVVTWTRSWGAGWLDGLAEVLDGPDEAGEVLIQWEDNGIIDIRVHSEVISLTAPERTRLPQMTANPQLTKDQWLTRRELFGSPTPYSGSPAR